MLETALLVVVFGLLGFVAFKFQEELDTSNIDNIYNDLEVNIVFSEVILRPYKSNLITFTCYGKIEYGLRVFPVHIVGVLSPNMRYIHVNQVVFSSYFYKNFLDSYALESKVVKEVKRQLRTLKPYEIKTLESASRYPLKSL